MKLIRNYQHLINTRYGLSTWPTCNIVQNFMQKTQKLKFFSGTHITSIFYSQTEKENHNKILKLKKNNFIFIPTKLYTLSLFRNTWPFKPLPLLPRPTSAFISAHFHPHNQTFLFIIIGIHRVKKWGRSGRWDFKLEIFLQHFAHRGWRGWLVGSDGRQMVERRSQHTPTISIVIILIIRHSCRRGGGHFRRRGSSPSSARRQGGKETRTGRRGAPDALKVFHVGGREAEREAGEICVA